MINLQPGFVEQFSDNVQLMLQQNGSLLQKCVRMETLETESKYYSSVGTLEAQPRGKLAGGAGYDIGGATIYKEVPMSRRQLNAEMVYWTAKFDRGDVSNVMLDPKSYYTKSAAWALGRQYDRVILQAFVGDVPGKKIVGGAISNDPYKFNYKTNAVPMVRPLQHDSNNNLAFVPLDPAVDADMNVNDGLTVEKLLKAREMLTRHYGIGGEKFYLVCSAAQISALLREDEIQSYDYNTVKALASGEVNSFLGFNFIVTDLLPGFVGRCVNSNDALGTGGAVADAGTRLTIRTCFAFAESALLFGKVKGQFLSRINEDPEHHFSLRFYCSDSIGAIRMDDNGVVAIHCAEDYRPEHLNIAGMDLIRGADLAAWNTAAKKVSLISTDIVKAK